MTMFTVKNNFNKLQSTFRKLDRDNEIAVVRAINIMGNRAVTLLSRLVAEEVGANVGTIKREFTTQKANRARKVYTIFSEGKRLGLLKPSTITRKGKSIGIRFTADDKKRTTITDNIDGGSKPFIIKGRYSKKKLAVYRKRGSKRTVTKLTWHSIPRITQQEYIDTVKKFMLDGIVEEYREQLKRLPYIKERKV